MSQENICLCENEQEKIIPYDGTLFCGILKDTPKEVYTYGGNREHSPYSIVITHCPDCERLVKIKPHLNADKTIGRTSHVLIKGIPLPKV